MTALEFSGVTVAFGSGHHRVRAVDQVDLTLQEGEVLGLVGESGSGKSTLARAAVGLVPLAAGDVLVSGADLSRLRRRERRARQRRVQMVFQDPYASLDPRMTIGDSLMEALRGRSTPRPERRQRIETLLDTVGLAARYAHLLPRELSGGQRQRVALARGLAAEPEVLVADEITSALDASVQGAILNLVNDLRRRLSLSVLFISHDLSVVRYLSDRIAVMYLGRIVEQASAQDLIARPHHPYTRALLSSVPRLVPADRLRAPALLEGDPPDPLDPPPGCRFHTRCPVGPLVDPERRVCVDLDPSAGAAERRHRSACHFST